MRRKDRQLSQADAYAVLQQSEYGFLATINPDGTPYCVPLTYAVLGEVVYFHGANQGQRLANAQHCPQACFSAVLQAENGGDQFTYRYASCVATGCLRVVQCPQERLAAIEAIAKKYAADFLATDAYQNALQALPRVTVVAMQLQSLTGKANKATPQP